MLGLQAAVLLLLALAHSAVLGFPGPLQTEGEEESSTSSSEGEDGEQGRWEAGPVQGKVRVVQVSPGALTEALLLRRARADLPAPLLGLPSVLQRGATGMALRPPYYIPSSRPEAPGQLLRALGPFRGAPVQVEGRQDMWRRVIQRGGRAETVLPLSQSDFTKSSCKAIPFTQTLSRDGCAPVKIQNRFCFGQCSSFYVPGPRTGAVRPCSGCAPSRIRKIRVALQCGKQVAAPEEEVMVVEECQCEAQGERDALQHLSTLAFQG
ncbi:DAN domain family member 5 [Ambystoma mexicanum]|uniref:DAN domain family member 5 n=1 Tax=Ambystoma mexicanum TaxID=8296 RepID=UPI0037E83154